MAGKVYPLSAPGLSLPGDDFLRAAELQGDTLKFEGKGKKRRLVGEHPRLTKLVCRALYGRGDLTLSVSASKQRSTVLNFVAGHVWREGPGDQRTTGPEPCDVMVVGSMCTDEDQQQQRLLQGRPGQYFLQTMQRLGLSCRGWYVTNLLKTSSPDPTASSQKATWFQAQQFLLEQELRLVRPKYILCLGSEAVKFFFGKNMSLEKSRGQVLEYSFPIGTDESSEAVHTATVITTLSPSYVSREKGSGFRDRFEQDLSNFVHLTKGVRCDQAETDIDHKVIRTLGELKRVLKQANAENPTKLVAVDAEWHGNHPQNEGAYLRCVQFSWAHKKAACVVFHAEGGEPDFWHTVVGPNGEWEVTTEGGAEAAVKLLKDYFADKRVVGHFFNSDLEWLVFNGLDLRPQFDAADKWQECPTKGGWDTGLMMHALDETSAFDLTTLSLKYTSAPRYDVQLDKWKADYCKRHNMKAAQLDGYGECPAEVLYPYANYDADVTRRIAVKLAPLLSKDPYGNNCWKPFWLAQRVAKVAYEINTTGLLVDRKRLDALFDVYSVKKAQMLQAIKEEFQWPNLNMASVQHVKELLFGEQYNGKRDPESGAPIKLRPPGAKSLYAQPVLNTAKRPKAWSEIMAEKKEQENSPSTGRQALGILLRESSSMKVRRNGKWVVEDCGRQVQMVRDYRFIEQVLKFVLRPPATEEVLTEDDSYVEEFMEDEDGDYIYDRGIPGFICSDCRIRTNMSQVKETGRWASSRPPLQNFSKRREEDYARILGDRYTSPLRSMFTADPGHLLVEADFVGAELFGMAILSGDVQMIDHARRNQLPEDHPDFYDIHSNIAVLAFGYKCPPTKSGLKSIGKAHMRIVAKCVPGHVRLQTSEGWLRMEALCGQAPEKQGLSVDESGVSVASLVGHTPLLSLYNGGRKRCRRIETERGYQLDTANGHHIAVMKADGKLGFKKAKDVKIGDWVALRMGADTFGRCVEFPQVSVPKRTNYKDLSVPAEFNKDWAAFLGLYVAEGSSDENGFQLCLAYEDDPELANETRCLLHRVFGTRVSEVEVTHEVWQNQKKFSVSSVKLAAWFRENVPGDSHTRRIPDFVFKWPKHLQAAFLRWLFEGDGSVKRNGSGVSVGYSTASEGLARDVQLLLTGFGVETSLASERREGYDGTYWALSVFGNESRARFAEQIGFVTEADYTRYEKLSKASDFKCDRRVVPSQADWLRDLMPAVRSPAKEKCRECVRERSRVALNPTRLGKILAAVDESKLEGKSREAYEHLRNLAGLPLVYQQVRSVTDIGILPVYDVETTPTNHHTVSYGGFLSHQSVVFGVAYGRGAKAIALAAREEGVTVSVEEAQTVIDTIFALYPNLVGFFEECRLRSASRDPKKPAPGWLRNALGRYRRFPATKDREIIGEFERQAMNFPIQSLIADAMNCAMHNLYVYRERWNLNFRFLLQIHDSLLFLVPNAEVPKFIDEVIPVCMERGVPIYPTGLDGRRKEGVQAYHLKTDVEVACHWGDPVYPHECAARGVHPKYAHWRKSALAKDAWESSSHPKKVYLSRDRRMHKLSDSGELVL